MGESVEKKEEAQTPDSNLQNSGLIISGALPADFPKEFDLVVVNMDKVLFEGKAKSVIVPIGKNNLAILPGHTPLFTKLDKGKVVINSTAGSSEELEIEDGIAKITQLKTVILVGF